MKRILLIALGAMAAVVAAGLIWAGTLPADNSATRSAVIAAPVERVFQRVTDAAAQPGWRSDVAEVRMEAAGRWTEVTRQGMQIAFREEEKRVPTLYVISFQASQGLTGRWEGRFESRGADTMVTFTETVRVEGWANRLLARLFAPPGALVERYIADLRRAVEMP